MSFDEFEIIDTYFGRLYRQGAEGVVPAAGDDCAIFDVPEGMELCVSTDTFISGCHFPDGASGDRVGHRALAANVSDLAAMGAKPMAALLALTLVEADEQWLQALSDVLERLTERWQIPLAGGNLARGRELSLTFTVMGTVPRGMALRRSGARPGDDVYVTGHPGEAGAGLGVLQRDPEASGELVDRYYLPEPRIDIGRQLSGTATAAIDVSDGIVADLGHVAKASGVNVVIEMDRLPLSTALLAAVDRSAARELALSAGQDYELCFTAAPDARSAITGIESACGVPITRIGRTGAGAGRVEVLDADGQAVQLASGGYRHFQP